MQIYTIKEAARKTKMGIETLKRACEEGLINATRLANGQWRIAESALEAALHEPEFSSLLPSPFFSAQPVRETSRLPRLAVLCQGGFPSADGSDSFGSRVRLWKWELQRLADETGLVITVGRLPAGTSKWNKIEHRLLAWISQNWRGKPLVSYAVILKLIAATTTETGLTVQCQHDTNSYPTGHKVSDEDMAALSIRPDPFLS